MLVTLKTIKIKGSLQGVYVKWWMGRIWVKLLSDDFMRTVAVTPGDSDVVYGASSIALEEGGYIAGSSGVMFSMDAGQSGNGASATIAYPFALTLQFDTQRTGDILSDHLVLDFKGRKLQAATPLQWNISYRSVLKKIIVRFIVDLDFFLRSTL